jgi:hypothetical protein
MVASRSEFKGNPMLVLKTSEDDKFPFQFGLRKAQLILDHIDDIKKFVTEHGK